MTDPTPEGERCPKCEHQHGIPYCGHIDPISGRICGCAPTPEGETK